MLPREACHVSLTLLTAVGLQPVLKACGLLRGLRLTLRLVELLDLGDVGGGDTALVEELNLANQGEEELSAVTLGLERRVDGLVGTFLLRCRI